MSGEGTAASRRTYLECSAVEVSTVLEKEPQLLTLGLLTRADNAKAAHLERRE